MFMRKWKHEEYVRLTQGHIEELVNQRASLLSQVKTMQDHFSSQVVPALETSRDLLKDQVKEIRARNEMSAMPAFVLVTITDAGIKHAWGPYASRGRAQAQQKRFEKDQVGRRGTVSYSILKVMSTDG